LKGPGAGRPPRPGTENGNPGGSKIIEKENGLSGPGRGKLNRRAPKRRTQRGRAKPDRIIGKAAGRAEAPRMAETRTAPC